MGQLLWETAWRAFKKLKLELPSDPRILLLYMCPSKGEEDFWKDIVHTCSQQNYGQNPKGGRNPNVQGEKNGSTTCGTHTTWNIYHGIVFGLKKQEDSDTCCNIEESRGHYGKWNTSSPLGGTQRVKITETVERWLPGAAEEGTSCCCLTGVAFQFCKMKGALETGCTTVRIYVTLLNRALKYG